MKYLVKFLSSPYENNSEKFITCLLRCFFKMYFLSLFSLIVASENPF